MKNLMSFALMASIALVTSSCMESANKNSLSAQREAQKIQQAKVKRQETVINKISNNFFAICDKLTSGNKKESLKRVKSLNIDKLSKDLARGSGLVSGKNALVKKLRLLSFDLQNEAQQKCSIKLEITTVDDINLKGELTKGFKDGPSIASFHAR